LPSSVRVFACRQVDIGWQLKADVFGKRYIYRIWCGGAAPPLLEPSCWVRPGRDRLNLDAMNQAANLLVGEHDYESFRSTHCQAAHARRAIWHLHVHRLIDHPDLPPGDQAGWLIEIDVRGNAFCHNQIRIIAGTLVDVGRGHMPPGRVQTILAQRDRSQAGITAPAQGLTLWRFYQRGDEEAAGLPSGLSWPGAPWDKSP
jgi:tRNA pseudouridine38-40 synthase